MRPLLQFYVYVLLDPRDDSVFYVGKGKGERALHHVDEVKPLIAQGAMLESAKHRRIQEILAAGGEPQALVVARFGEEEQAHAVESVLINFGYDFERLTNSVRGHGAEFVRRFGDLRLLPGIDIPQRVRSNDGTYTTRNFAALQVSGAFDLHERLRLQLVLRGFEPRDFAPNTPDRAFDPGRSNGRLGWIVPIHGIDFLVAFSKACRPGVAIANTTATRTAVAYAGFARIELAKGPDFHVGPSKNTEVNGEGRYRDFEIKPTFDSDNLEALFKLLDEFRTILEPRQAGAAS
jgi:hypothetical protein